MNLHTCLTALTLAAGLGATPLLIHAAENGASSGLVTSGDVQSHCSAKTKGPYGFQCQGFANVGAGLEPVTLVGTVAGSSTGVFSGYGQFNSSLGSLKQHLVGPAAFQNRSCFGHVRYRVWLVGENNVDVAELAPLDIDFATVNNGREILGTPNSPAGTGDAVPRLSCRLVGE